MPQTSEILQASLRMTNIRHPFPTSKISPLDPRLRGDD